MPETKAQTDEHPIIFSGWSIRRILAGEKVQTRRVVKPQPEKIGADVWAYKGLTFYDDEAMRSRLFCEAYRGEYPYGTANQMWVREAFRLPEWADDISPSEYVKDDRFVKGTPPVRFVRFEADGRATPFYDYVTEEGWGRKRSPIHMPRALCHYVLRVESVRVERLLDISEDDAMAEGVKPVTRRSASVHGGDTISAVIAFKERWNEVHGSGAWQKNPWIWVISFSKIDE